MSATVASSVLNRETCPAYGRLSILNFEKDLQKRISANRCIWVSLDVCVFREFCALGNPVFKKTSGKERRGF